MQGLCGGPPPVGVSEHLAADADPVGVPRGKNGFSLQGLLNKSHGKGHQPRFFFHNAHGLSARGRDPLHGFF